MKVLILDTRPLRRGAQIFAHDLSNALISRRQLEVKKIYLYDVKQGELIDINPQDEVLGGNDQHITEKFPTVHPQLLHRLVKRINAFQPDVILLNGSRTLKYSAAANPFLRKKPKVVYRVIDSAAFWNNEGYKQLYYRRLVMPHIDGAVGVSAASLADMKQLHQFKKPTVVIHRAIDVDQFKTTPDRTTCRQELGINENVKIVVLLGNLTLQKRPDRFISLIHEIRKGVPQIRGWIIGDGPLRAQIEDQVNKLGVEENIVFYGYRKQVGKFLQAADLLFLTSDTEGLPGVVLEAAFFGVPAISTRVGGVAECIEDGQSGYIVPLWEQELFLDRAIALLNDEEMRNRMGRSARDKVLEAFTVDKIVNDYHRFFKHLVERI